MDCVIYIRWSSTEQSRGSSRERQLEDCRNYAKSKGWNVVNEMEDEGVSAFKGEHAKTGKLGLFVNDVESGEYPDGVILLTEKLDRLSREEPGRVFMWMMRVTEAGVVVATVDGDRRYERGKLDMAGIIEVIVKFQLAHEESKKKSDRVAAAWRSKRARLSSGERITMTRRTPAWIRVDENRRLVLVEDRTVIVRRIFEDTASGIGKHSIARRLNQEGVDTFGKASAWHASYIQKILHNAAVLGEMQPGRKARGSAREHAGDPIADYYPAAVDADLHARAMRSMSNRSRRVAGRGRRLANMFAGIAKCSGCEARMTFRGKGVKVRADGQRINEDYLVCDSYQRGRGCTNGQHFHYGAWESAVLNAILSRAMGDGHFSSRSEVRALEVEQAELARRRDTARRKATTALALHFETEHHDDKAAMLAFRAEAERCEAALAEIRQRITAARGAVSPAQHQKRIEGVFDEMEHEDEVVRFEARSRVMEAVHALVTTMTFRSEPPIVEVTTTGGVACAIECVAGRGPASEFWYRYDEGFFS